MMDDMPKVSLLIPVYNVEAYLRECLESARRQTLGGIEVVCINDGSTDGSRAIVQEYLDADPRFRAIDKPNTGYGDSMNRGLAAARGEYVAFLESDDFIDPEGLEEMYRAAVENDAEVVKSNYYFHWSVPEPRDDEFFWVKDGLSGLIDPRERREVLTLPPSVWTALYKKSFLDETGIRFLPTPGASFQDAGFAFKVWALCRRAFLIKKAYVHYRLDNDTSSSHAEDGKVFCVCDEYGDVGRFVDENPQLGDDLRAVLCVVRFDSYTWNYWRLNERRRKEFLPRMVEELREEDRLGYVDYSLFTPEKAELRKLVVSDPKLFVLMDERPADMGGKLGTLKYYFQKGGLDAIARVVRYKLRSR